MKAQVKISVVLFGASLVMFVLGCGQNKTQQLKEAEKLSPVIYGEDNRKDYSEITDATLKEMARSTVALISKELMTLDTVFNVFRLEKNSTSLPLCSSEPFREQSTWAHCSGSLIGDDVILTAGHCVVDAKDCQSAYYVFDYKLDGREKIFSQVSANSVYTCSEIIYTSAHDKNLADFALIRLDRKVEDRKPLALSDKEVLIEDKLMMVGYPSGYPTKFTFDGKIRSLTQSNYMTIAIDAYTGNSGSSVFDQETHQIVGVLSRGEKDYVLKNSCLVSNVCDEEVGCRGEDVTRIEQVKKFLPKDMQPAPTSTPEN